MENKKGMQNNFKGMKIGCRKMQNIHKPIKNNFKDGSENGSQKKQNPN